MALWRLDELLSEFQVGWYLLSIFLVFVLGALWYSAIFSRRWTEVFDVRVGKPTIQQMLLLMGIETASSALSGIVYFVLTKLSLPFALTALLIVVFWDVATLTSRYTDKREFGDAVLIQSGHEFLAGLIYISLGSL
jgi:hypothetical protein